MAELASSNALLCTHCGALAGVNPKITQNEVFCCEGCSTVYEIINKNGLCDYYKIDPNAAISLNTEKQSSWSLQELDLMESEFIISDSAETKTVLFYIPSIHCSSCIWLLEKLTDIDAGIFHSRSDFLNKKLVVSYNPQKTSFGKIVILLRTLGYEPSLMPEDDAKHTLSGERTILLKLGLAGFCTGNIMIFSFPQYFGLNYQSEPAFYNFFNVFNVLLSLPVIFYCASDYFKSLWHWLIYKSISVKVPLAIGIGTLWLRSLYEILSKTGSGYFDSLAGLVFFLIAGSWLQSRVFKAMRFGEKAKKFFPLVVRTVVNGVIIPKKVVELLPGERIVVSHAEIIPADGVLMSSSAQIQYAFATGESTPQVKVAGEILLGGGKNTGGNIEMEVIRSFNEGRLSEIWNSSESNKRHTKKSLSFEQTISRYFILGTVVIALSTLIFWLPINSSTGWFAFTAVLMVACPCALALAPPFAYNIVARYFASKGFYLRKPEVVGEIGEAQVVVFDKTGTLTSAENMAAEIPSSFEKHQRSLLLSIAAQSTHPYSKAIAKTLYNSEPFEVHNFKEFPGKGISGIVCGQHVKLGDYSWVTSLKPISNLPIKQIWFSANGLVLEPINIKDIYRPELLKNFTDLKAQKLELILASGDHLASKTQINEQFPGIFSKTYFNCSPAEKCRIIGELQPEQNVIMVGDGINDAGALNTCNTGIVVTETTNNFTPEASAILLQNNFNNIPHFIMMAKRANAVIKEAFVVSLIYNITAISLAISGKMEPVIAAIMMPASSILLMVYAVLRTQWIVKKGAQK